MFKPIRALKGRRKVVRISLAQYKHDASLLRSYYDNLVLTTTVQHLCNDNVTFMPRCSRRHFLLIGSFDSL